MNQKDVCCPKLDIKKWEGKTHNWKNKLFIKESIPTFFHIPFPPSIAKKITKMWQAAEDAKANIPQKDEVLVLFADPTPFRSDIYLSVSKKVANTNNTSLSGTFISKVYDGSYNAVPNFIKDMDQYLSEQGKVAKRYYIHYAYCPKCAAKFKKNHMVLFAEV